MGNVFTIFSTKPKPVVEDSIEVFEPNPSAKIIELDVDEEAEKFRLN